MVAFLFVLAALFVLALLGVPLWFGAGREGRVAVFRLVSRIFVSAERRPPAAALREGGLDQLPPGLYKLMVRRRRLEAAVHTLQQLAPDYHETFDAPSNDIGTDRRHQALRRDFEDAVIHVTHALDGWCEALDWLDDEANKRLQAVGPIPDVPALLERFPWLPREVHEIGHLHFSADEPLFEKALFELDAALWRVEEALTRKRPGLYR